MTVVTLEEFRAHVDRYLAAAAQGDVLLTWDGKPCVLLRAVPEDGEMDSEAFANSADFWRMIQERRQEHGIPWDEAKKTLGLD